jgi:hypothetical protein
MVEDDCGVGVDRLDRNEERARVALFREKERRGDPLPFLSLLLPLPDRPPPLPCPDASLAAQVSPGPILQPRTLQREASPVQAAAACGHDVWVGGSKGWGWRGWRVRLRGVGSA